LQEFLYTIDAALGEVDAARKRVRRTRGKQVRAVDDVAMLKATAHTWFCTHQPSVQSAGRVDLSAVDRAYTILLEATSKTSAKTTYLEALQRTKEELVAARSAGFMVGDVSPTVSTDDTAPDFSSLVGDKTMQSILNRRWMECVKCVDAGAHLAAIVMMGGLLEALFVARANVMPDKKVLVQSASAARDREGKPKPYQEWMLDTYIKVGFELGWITVSAKDVANTLKDYRNYIHPEKERRHGITLSANDSTIFWDIVKALTRQVLGTV
jgi:hypothetical protein